MTASSIAADAFGNALAHGFVESMTSSPTDGAGFQASIKRNETENWLMGSRADGSGFNADMARRASENWLMSPSNSRSPASDGTEGFIASGDALSTDGIIDLGDGRIQLADGRVRRASVTVGVSTIEPSVGLYTNAADQQVQRAPFASQPPEGAILPTIYVAPNVPMSLQSKFGPILAAYDQAGQGYWHVPTENGAVTVTPPPGYEVPSQWELQGKQIAGGLKGFFTDLPGSVFEAGMFIGDGYRLIGHAAVGDLGSFGPRSSATGNVTFDSAALAVIKSSPVGAMFGSPRDMGAAIAALPFAAVGPVRGQSFLSVTRGEAGRFADLAARATKGDMLTPHHMPQAAAGFTTRADGGALMLTEAEHLQTRTYGFKGALTAQQEAEMSFRDVLARDIRDVRGITGTRYNEGLRDLLDYYRVHFPGLMNKAN